VFSPNIASRWSSAGVDPSPFFSGSLKPRVIVFWTSCHATCRLDGVQAGDVPKASFRKLLASVLNSGFDVDEAMSLAFRQIRDGIADEQIVQHLRDLPGGSKTLRKAARLAATGDPGYPVNRCVALLKAAAEGLPAPELPAEQRAQQEAQRQLMIGDPASGFALLARRASALLDLEHRARAGLSKPEWDEAMRHAADGADRETKAIFVSMFLMKESPLVGPESHSPDALLASQAAKNVVSVHLTLVANVSPPMS
jgi:hypothetical protein